MFHKETSLVLKLIKELNEFVKGMSRIELEKNEDHSSVQMVLFCFRSISSSQHIPQQIST